MRSLGYWMTIVGTAVFAPWAVGQGPEKADRDRLQGTWMAAAAEIGGRPSKGETTVVFDGEQFRLLDGGKELARGTFALDEAKSPKWIDFKVPVPKGVDPADATVKVSLPGIYELDGDTFKLCWGGDRRPTGFASKTPHQFFATYQRRAK